MSDALLYAVYMLVSLWKPVLAFCVLSGVFWYAVLKLWVDHRGESDIEVNHQRRRY